MIKVYPCSEIKFSNAPRKGIRNKNKHISPERGTFQSILDAEIGKIEVLTKQEHSELHSLWKNKL